jgi:hypothetical protein
MDLLHSYKSKAEEFDLMASFVSTKYEAFQPDETNETDALSDY